MNLQLPGIRPPYAVLPWWASALHPEFAPGSPASVTVHAEVFDVPWIKYSDVDEYALETFLLKIDA